MFHEVRPEVPRCTGDHGAADWFWGGHVQSVLVNSNGVLKSARGGSAASRGETTGRLSGQSKSIELQRIPASLWLECSWSLCERRSRLPTRHLRCSRRALSARAEVPESAFHGARRAGTS